MSAGRFATWLLVSICVSAVCIVAVAAAISPNTDWVGHPVGGVLVIVFPLFVAFDWARRVLKNGD